MNVMIFIVCALACEAGPIIRSLGLGRDLAVPGFERFDGPRARLIVSGIGKLRSAIATTSLLAAASPAELEGSCAVNIGLCGAPGEHAIGRLLWINKVTDAGSRRRYYPDILARHELPEAQLVTHDRPYYGGEESFAGAAADMEAAGFFEAASCYLSWSRLACLKAVSDHLERRKLTPLSAESLVSLCAPEIARVLDRLSETCAPRPAPIGLADRALLDALRGKLKLTAAQCLLLDEWAGDRLIRGSSLDGLSVFLDLAPQGKAERNRIFREIRDALASA